MRPVCRFLALLCVGLLWPQACDGTLWWSSRVEESCDPHRDPRITGHSLWRRTFGRQNARWAYACLRISWGTQKDQGIGLPIQLSKQGIATAKNPDTGEFDVPIQFQLPREARDELRLFHVFVFGRELQSSVEKHEDFCRVQMAQPAYRCQSQGECWFGIQFRPEGTGGQRAQELPDAGTCRLLLPDALSELPASQEAREPQEGGPGDPDANADAKGPEPAPPEPPGREPEPSDASEPPRREPPHREPPRREPPPERDRPDGLRPPEPPTPELPSKPPDFLKAMGWCNESHGNPITNAFYQQCQPTKDKICFDRICRPRCNIGIPPKACPSGSVYKACGIHSKGHFCFPLCTAKDFLDPNYDPKCPVGMFCESGLSNGAHRGSDHCQPSDRFEGYATGTKGLGESCTKSQGCDGSRGFFCYVSKGTTGTCQRACDPRSPSALKCPSGQSCTVDLRSFAQGRCE